MNAIPAFLRAHGVHCPRAVALRPVVANIQFSCKQFRMHMSFSRIRMGIQLWVLVLCLAGCREPVLHDRMKLLDAECQPLVHWERQVPTASSLYGSLQWQQRQAVLASMYETVPRADLHALQTDINPALSTMPQTPRDPLPAWQEGDVMPFQVTGMQASWQVEAELQYRSDTSYAWVETGTAADMNYIRALAAYFDRSIYDAVRWHFGPEALSDFDRDLRVHLLFVRNLGPVLGYFSGSADLSQPVAGNVHGKDMLFLNLDHLGNMEQDLEVLVHEFQHLIHWTHDPGERGFINEGFSELAPLLVLGDYPWTLGRFDAYRRNPSIQLNDWSATDSGRHYGAGLGFALYLAELWGPSFLRQVVLEPRAGMAGLDALLARQGCPFAADDIFADFVLANLVWRPDLMGGTGRLGYAALASELDPVPLSALRPATVPEDSVPVRGRLAPYAVHYVARPGTQAGQALQISFQGDASVPIAPAAIDAVPQQVMWSNRHNGSQTRLQRTFDLGQVPSGSAARLVTRMWWDIEEHWDYGYVMASRNGRDWELLQNDATVTDDPIGHNLGAGLTGQSSTPAATPGWRVDYWDLSPYAGSTVSLRFDYVTDDALTTAGWLIDEIALPAIGYREGFEAAVTDWEVAGWIRTDNRIPVTWLVQVLHVGKSADEVRGLYRFLADMDGALQMHIESPGPDETVYLVVSPLAPLITTEAQYEIIVHQGTE